METAEAIEKARKLKQMSELGTENERQVAYRLFMQIMGKFNLTNEDLYNDAELAERQEIEKAIQNCSASKMVVAITKARNRLVASQKRFQKNPTLERAGFMSRLSFIINDLDRLAADVATSQRRLPRVAGKKDHKQSDKGEMARRCRLYL